MSINLPDDFAENLQQIAATFRELERTILFGWPHNEYPTETEANTIVAVWHELSMQHHTCGLDESERWYLAGQIVARIKRDVKVD